MMRRERHASGDGTAYGPDGTLRPMTTLVHLVSEGEAAHRELPMNPWMYGVIAIALFGLGLLVLWSFRGNANKVHDTGETHDFGHSHGHGPGATSTGHH